VASPQPPPGTFETAPAPVIVVWVRPSGTTCASTGWNDSIMHAKMATHTCVAFLKLWMRTKDCLCPVLKTFTENLDH
jgi:hypothetical protein